MKCFVVAWKLCSGSCEDGCKCDLAKISWVTLHSWTHTHTHTFNKNICHMRDIGWDWAHAWQPAKCPASMSAVTSGEVCLWVIWWGMFVSNGCRYVTYGGRVMLVWQVVMGMSIVCFWLISSILMSGNYKTRGNFKSSGKSTQVSLRSSFWASWWAMLILCWFDKSLLWWMCGDEYYFYRLLLSDAIYFNNECQL